MSDIVKETEKRLLKQMLARYKQAGADLERGLSEILGNGKSKADALRKQYLSGKITQTEYKQRMTRLLLSLSLRSKSKELAGVMADANEDAYAGINAEIPAVLRDGINREAWEAEMDVRANVGLYPLSDAETRQLLDGEVTFFPEKKLDRQKDTRWNQKNIMAGILTGIAVGIAIDRLPTYVANRVRNRNYNNMKERTYETLSGAWETGRDSMVSEEERKGLKPQKEWIATLDFKTRDAHRELDGQRVDPDKPYTVNGDEIWFPRDPSAPAYLRCNCRCAERIIRAKYDIPATRKENLRTPLPGGGWEKKILPYMKYDEWYEMKRREMGDIEIQKQIKEMKREQQQKYYRKRKREREKAKNAS